MSRDLVQYKARPRVIDDCLISPTDVIRALITDGHLDVFRHYMMVWTRMS